MGVTLYQRSGMSLVYRLSCPTAPATFASVPAAMGHFAQLLPSAEGGRKFFHFCRHKFMERNDHLHPAELAQVRRTREMPSLC